MPVTATPAKTNANQDAIQRFCEYSMLGMLASGYLAIAGSGYLAPVPLALTGLALLIRGLMSAGVIRLRLPPHAVTILTLIYIGVFPIDYFYISRTLLGSTLHLIFFVVTTKILTASTSRDYFYVRMIALVELLAASLLSASSNFFLFLGLFLVFTVAAFTSDEMYRSLQKSESGVVVYQRFRSTSLALFVLAVSIGILVITAGLFFVLPRTARVALQHLASSHYRLAGFSNQVDLGEIGEIKKQDTPVMHIQPERGIPGSSPSRMSALKWRGAALAEFDGHRWFNPPGMREVMSPDKPSLYILATADDRRRSVPRFTYLVHLNEIAGDALFFAGKPEFVWIETPFLVQSSPGVYRRQAAASGQVTYRAQSFVENGEPLNDPADGRMMLYLQLPSMDPRVSRLAKATVAGDLDPLQQAHTLESYLRRTYAYTLELPSSEPADPIATFLFERRKGHCEYFASSLAVMLRIVGIPSRVVTGFQGGVYNPISSQQLIRASDAHSWVEAWIPKHGWVTLDPTPPDYSGNTQTLWSQASLYLDAADVFWQEWVLNYSLDHQLVLASRMEESGRRMRATWPERFGNWISQEGSSILAAGLRAKWLLLLGAAAAALLWSFGPDSWRFWRTRLRFQRALRGKGTPSDATILYERLLRQLRRRGIEKPPWLTPIEFARVVREPELAEIAAEAAEAYNEVRFGGRPDGAARMVQLLARLE